MAKTTEPSEQLNEEDQMAAIDVAIAAVLIGLRIPSAGKPLYDFLGSEFASSRGLPPNVVRYALRHLGQGLFAQDWTLVIEKRGAAVITKFSHPETSNGEGTIIVE
jgi:hypothetical protein